MQADLVSINSHDLPIRFSGMKTKTSLGQGSGFARSRAPSWFPSFLSETALAVVLRVGPLSINWLRFQSAGRLLVV